MPKQQRTVQLPSDVYVFAEAYEAGTGIKFNRQILAAFLRFIFEEFDDYPNSIWIGLATSVERGTMQIEDLPLRLATINVGQYESELKRRKKGQSAIPDLGEEELRRRLKGAKDCVRKWEERIKEHGDARKALLANIKGSVLAKIVKEYDTPQ